MNRFRQKLLRPYGAMLALAVVLCFAGVHLLHFHTEANPAHAHFEVQTGPGHQHAQAHDAAQAVCPICSLLAHSALDRGRGPVSLSQPQAADFLAAAPPRSLPARDVASPREPRAPPFLAG